MLYLDLSFVKCAAVVCVISHTQQMRRLLLLDGKILV